MNPWAIMALVAAFAGWAALAGAMSRHAGNAASTQRLRGMQVAGWLGLILSYAACGAMAGWALGTVWWFGIGSLAAVSVALMLAYAQRWLMPLIVAGLVAAVATSARQLF